MWWGRRGQRGARQVLIIKQVAVISCVAFHRQRGRGFTSVGAAHPVRLQTWGRGRSSAHIHHHNTPALHGQPDVPAGRRASAEVHVTAFELPTSRKQPSEVDLKHWKACFQHKPDGESLQSSNARSSPALNTSSKSSKVVFKKL